MNSIIVIAKRDWSAARFAQIAATRWGIRDASETRCVIEAGPMHVIINEDDAIRNDCSEEEISVILLTESIPRFFMFEFNDFSFGKSVLALLSDNDGIMIDDDHGKLWSGREFSTRIEADICFDWRTDRLHG